MLRSDIFIRDLGSSCAPHHWMVETLLIISSRQGWRIFQNFEHQNESNFIETLKKLFSIDYSTIQPSENPILIEPCQLYPERGNTTPNGVQINWTADKSISDFIYGLGSGIFKNLLALFNNGFGEKLLSSTQIIHFTGIVLTTEEFNCFWKPLERCDRRYLGGASKFVEPEARKKFPNHKIVTDETLGAAIGAAKFLQIQR